MKMRNEAYFFPNSPEAIGVIEKAVSPETRGRVSFKGSHWFAALSQNNGSVLQQGELVKIVGRTGITLIVSPLP